MLASLPSRPLKPACPSVTSQPPSQTKHYPYPTNQTMWGAVSHFCENITLTPPDNLVLGFQMATHRHVTCPTALNQYFLYGFSHHFKCELCKFDNVKGSAEDLNPGPLASKTDALPIEASIHSRSI